MALLIKKRPRLQLILSGVLAVVLIIGTIVLVRGSRTNTEIAITPDSKTSCFYLGSSSWKTHLTAVEKVIKSSINCIELYADRDPTWADWDYPWPVRLVHFGYSQWLKHGGNYRTIILSLPLVPLSVTKLGSPLYWESMCAHGAYDGYVRRLAEHLVKAGWSRVVIRLGVEMNGNWESDYSGSTPVDEAEWADCFRHEVLTLRSSSRSDFLFEWNPSSCGVPVLPQLYPGNSVVDIIGVDIYDAKCSGSLSAARLARWPRLASEYQSVNTLEQFAQTRNKPISISEWGLVKPPKGGGDDPFYIEGLASFVEHHEVSFQSYFDCGCDDVLPLGSFTPRATKAYVSAFG